MVQQNLVKRILTWLKLFKGEFVLKKIVVVCGVVGFFITIDTKEQTIPAGSWWKTCKNAKTKKVLGVKTGRKVFVKITDPGIIKKVEKKIGGSSDLFKLVDEKVAMYELCAECLTKNGQYKKSCIRIPENTAVPFEWSTISIINNNGQREKIQSKKRSLYIRPLFFDYL